jgi:hypothetical protein
MRSGRARAVSDHGPPNRFEQVPDDSYVAIGIAQHRAAGERKR